VRLCVARLARERRDVLQERAFTWRGSGAGSRSVGEQIEQLIDSELTATPFVVSVYDFANAD